MNNKMPHTHSILRYNQDGSWYWEKVKVTAEQHANFVHTWEQVEQLSQKNLPKQEKLNSGPEEKSDQVVDLLRLLIAEPATKGVRR